MSDRTDQTDDKKKPLTLSRKVDLSALTSGDRRAGRSKTVIVEVKKNRSIAEPTATQTPKEDSGMRSSQPVFTKQVPKKESLREERDPAKTPPSLEKNTKTLTDEELEARLKALHGATKFVEKKAAELDETARRHEELRQLREEEIKSSQVEEIHADERVSEPSAPVESSEVEAEADKRSKFKAFEVKKQVPGKSFELRRPGKISVTQALSNEGGEEGFQSRRSRSLTSLRRAREKERLKMQRMGMSQEKIIREVVIPESISVQELANRMAERSSDVVKCFMKLGMMVTLPQAIDGDTAQLVAEELGHKVKRVADSDVEDVLIQEMDTETDLQSRAPVVTIMGHVDHGKTSLLDALRTTDVVSTEAGGITQHIGAYQVTLNSGQKITFIDTPGHAAFTEMRARGANATDIVVLVVAADDGVKDQTIEAINHAKAAKVPIIVAINKIDKPAANSMKIRQALMQHEIFVEELGGDILSIEVSAKQKLNLDKLEEAILLQAEIMNLKGNPNRLAAGVVIESRLEKGRGPVATTLIQKGTLKIGDFFVAGAQWGRVRALINDHGQSIKEAGLSVPVEVIGLNGLPEAGDAFVVTQEESKAREIAEYRQSKLREKLSISYDKQKMENLFAQQGTHKELAILIKADVQGSMEAIITSLQKMQTDEVSVRILHSGVGGINETDISLAKASKALILGFNVRANLQAREMAQRDNLEIRYYSIIYDALEDVKALLGGLLSPILKEHFLGRAEIRKVFKITGSGMVAGCYVTEGLVKRGAKVRLLRDDVVIHEGALKTLKRMKDEVKEVKQGFECGMAFENYENIREGDVIECSEIETIARTL
jgi:translation initiation factor IF-2